MKVQDVMTRGVYTCAPTTNLAEVAELMWIADCGAVPIVDGGAVVGIVTDRDTCIALGTSNRRASDVMAGEMATRPVITCAGSDELQHALRIMRVNQIRRLPVVDLEGNLEGILCLREIVFRAHKGDRTSGELTYEDVTTTLKAIYENRPEEIKEPELIAVAIGAV